MTDSKSGGILKSQFEAGVAFQNPAAKMLERGKGGKNVQSDAKLGTGSSSLGEAKRLSLRWCSEAENDDMPL